jgi:putative ABC transport system ATP-binding protein
MLITATDLCKSYVNEYKQLQPVLHNLNLTVDNGEFIAIMGPSGSGKSTLMHILGCLEPHTSGTLTLAGRDVTSLNAQQLAQIRNRQIGFVFQNFNLLAKRTILDNVCLPMLYADIASKERVDTAMEMLSKMGLAGFEHRLPSQLSGGQRQRVAIARALVNKPQLIFADEPTGNLDTKTSEDIMALLSQLNQQQQVTLILVTHELDIAYYAKRLIRIRDGQIEYDGAVNDIQ